MKSTLVRCVIDALALIACLVVIPSTSWAQAADPCTKPIADIDAAESAFQFFGASCVGSELDPFDTIFAAAKYEEEVTEDPKRLMPSLIYFREMARQVGVTTGLGSDEVFSGLDSRFVVLLTAVEQFDPKRKSGLDDLLLAESWTVETTRSAALPHISDALPQIRLLDVVRRACEAVACQQGYDALIMLTRVSKLTHDSLNTLNTNQIRKNDEAKALAAKKWESYRADAPVQYLWELYFNSQAINWINPVCTDTHTRSITSGEPADCRIPGEAPPEWSLSFLHPEATFEYVNEADANESLLPGIQFDIIGYNWLNYDAEGTIKSVWGVSAGILYVKRDNAADARAAFGIRFGKGLAGGISYGDDELGFFLNASFGELVRSSQTTFNNAYKRFKAPLK